MGYEINLEINVENGGRVVLEGIEEDETNCSIFKILEGNAEEIKAKRLEYVQIIKDALESYKNES